MSICKIGCTNSSLHSIMAANLPFSSKPLFLKKYFTPLLRYYTFRFVLPVETNTYLCIYFFIVQFCPDYETSNKKKFPTFARSRPPDTQISKSVASVLKYFNWTHVSIISKFHVFFSHKLQVNFYHAKKFP